MDFNQRDLEGGKREQCPKKIIFDTTKEPRKRADHEGLTAPGSKEEGRLYGERGMGKMKSTTWGLLRGRAVRAFTLSTN